MTRALRALTDFAGGLAAGFAFGCAVALLLAPAEGSESRARLRDSAKDLTDAPRQIADEVQDRVQQAVVQGRRAAAEARADLETRAGLHQAPTSEPAGDEGPAVI